MKYVIIALLISQICYAEQPYNVVYNNGPVASGSGEGVAMERLRSTEKELDHMTFERNSAFKELAYQQSKSGFGSALLWTVVGIAAGGAGTYFLTRNK